VAGDQFLESGIVALLPARNEILIRIIDDDTWWRGFPRRQ
jgi:hypothetical protein